MPDDRPVSPEERLQRARAGIAHLRTLSFVDEADALVAILDVALSTPAGPLAEDNENFDPWGGGSPNAAAGPSPEPWTDPALFPHLNHPAPREEAVEAAGVPDERDVSLVARALEGVCDSAGRPMILRERQDLARGALFAVALSAARPPSPTPEETGHWHEYVGGRCIHCGVVSTAPDTYIPARDPGDDATTKEGR